MNNNLSHLVEAATALTKLVDIQPPQSQALENESNQAASLPFSSRNLLLEKTSQAQQSELQLQPQRSVVSDDDEESKGTKAVSPLNVSNRTASGIPSNGREIFPQRLMQILADTNLGDVISWLPHGRSFVIIRPDVFSERVLPRYFPSTDSRSSTKYPSFTRKLNRWGFRQATRGPDTGAFHHPLFRRDQPQLCLDMVCQKSRKRSSSSKNKSSIFAKNEAQQTNNSATTHLTALQPRISTPGNLLSEVSAVNNATGTMSVPLTEEALAALAKVSQNNQQFCFQKQKISTVSLDDRSVSSGSSSAVSTNNIAAAVGLMKTHNYAVAAAATTPISSWVPTDPNLVAVTLRLREERERLCVAKSMLYEAYLTALRG